ncbi:DUF1289 domain-containing protein [Methylobacterium adhaesivum]|uniref:DUF1289 domain-containing protein n=1 Tax=Methylobacterium adhaesivum TaxID=333297 RepID=A0ABT8BJ10_9HYPH|nr:DUF1289 domain-containing protein [Methylobacterium adhaesivum]MDN3591670.1 DUF1289 domain-containing protein [Methylobacterium adhaesivum]
MLVGVVGSRHLVRFDGGGCSRKHRRHRGAFDSRTGWCFGCGHTIPEIRAWRKLTDFRRTALARDLPRCVSQVGEATPVDREN